MTKNIYIKGARQHNLRNIDVEIPRDKLTVITGLSGSGKSSLAFDTLYAEGQRRYVESLSAYARQFLDRMQKPKVEHIEGLSPAIAIEQRSAGSSPRSTVATVTEIYDYLRLLYAHAGIAHCPECGKELHSQSAQSICEKILAYPEGKKLMVLAPFVSGRKGEHREIFEQINAEGFVRVRVDGDFFMLDENSIELDKNKRHTIEAVVDRLISGKMDPSRLNDSIELALKHGDGVLTILLENPDPNEEPWIEEQISEHLACLDCKVSFGKLLPRNFSFNSPYGACKRCSGLGALMTMDPDLVVPDDTLSIRKGAIPGWRRGPRRLIIYYNMLLRKLAEHLDCPDMLSKPFKDLDPEVRKAILFGTDDNIEFTYTIRGRRHLWSKPFEGVLLNMQRRLEETDSESVRDRLRKYLSPRVCPDCDGARLNPVSLAVTVSGLSINEFNALPVEKAYEFFENLELSEEAKVISEEVVREIKSRLGFLNNVGLSYLTLDRQSSTLSGGEAQRIRLATQLGCGLVGVLYILDEPSIGLHQRDNDRLLDTLMTLRDIGNTVIVVEHDLDTILRADHVLDLGPGAGRHGGEIVAEGTPEEVRANKKSLTGQFLAGTKAVDVPEKRIKGTGEKITIKGATHNNLKNIDVDIPLGTFCCITGVSGSGKSSLVNEILKPALNRHLKINDVPPGSHKTIKGLEAINKAIIIDQSPIGRTPRSNPATYTDAFAHIRRLFSELPESKIRGYKPGRFSFNVKGGRCEACRGDGIKKIEMQFLADVYVECSACNGKRFNAETLNIRYKKQNIADVLDMTVNEATEFFSAHPPLYRKLKTLQDVGLGYVHLGQAATTLSGGEAQRVKLASELSRIPRGHTIYILDEPTTGLHLADIKQLLDVLFQLRDKGNTVLVIEHNLDVIKTADHIIDLGPEGGDAGGQVIAKGTPEQVAKVKASYTGQYLKQYLS
jgi:excinuclease ABC subunit A